MIDEGQRHRRRVLGWVLIALAAVLLVACVVSGQVVAGEAMLGAVRDSYALATGVVLIFLALAGSGVYLLHTVRGR